MRLGVLPKRSAYDGVPTRPRKEVVVSHWWDPSWRRSSADNREVDRPGRRQMPQGSAGVTWEPGYVAVWLSGGGSGPVIRNLERPRIRCSASGDSARYWTGLYGCSTAR